MALCENYGALDWDDAPLYNGPKKDLKKERKANLAFIKNALNLLSVSVEMETEDDSRAISTDRMLEILGFQALEEFATIREFANSLKNGKTSFAFSTVDGEYITVTWREKAKEEKTPATSKKTAGKKINLINGGTCTIYKREEMERIADKLNFTLQSFQQLFRLENSSSYPAETVIFVTKGSRYKDSYSGYYFSLSSREWLPSLVYQKDVPMQVVKKFKK